MHDTAYEHGRLFFQVYGANQLRTIVDLGSQDVNGTLRDHCPPGTHYIGLDMAPAKGVDLVVGANLPIADNSIDAIVTSSAFEHDVCFWETFLELLRILRPGGLLYVNAPSNDAFHRYPLDCWRFYPDAGVALVQWAARRGVEVEVLESFVALPKAEAWVDFVAVFRKAGGPPLSRNGRIADHTKALNIYDRGMQPGGPLEAQTHIMPDMQNALDLTAALRRSEADLAAATQANATATQAAAAATQAATAATQAKAAAMQANAAAAQTNAALSNDIATAHAKAAALGLELRAATNRITELQTALSAATHQIESIQASRSWRLTAGLRWLGTAMRGH
jgi:SAM-dependent methyltransferase